MAKWKKILNITIAGVFLFLGTLSAFASQGLSAEPGDGWFGSGDEEMGYSMYPYGAYISDTITDSGTRRLNFEEMFSGVISKNYYYGEKAGDNAGYFGPYELNSDRYSGILDDVAEKKAISARHLFNDWYGPVGAFFTNLMNNIIYIPFYIGRAVITTVFNPQLFCAAPEDTMCIDLASVIGGHGKSGEGLIGALTSSIYIPLATLAVLISAIAIFKKGVVDRSYREALSMILWVFISFTMFLAFLLNPSLIARAPMYATNTLVGCVSGAMTGTGCNGDATQEGNQNKGNEVMCAGSVPDSSSDKNAEVTASNISCLVYKNLYLSALSAEYYNLSIPEMDTNSDTPFAKAADEAGIDRNTFCVPLTVTRTPNQFTSGTALSGDKVCNGFAYHAYLQSGAKAGGLPDQVQGTDAYPSPGQLDKRWYNLIATTAHLPRSWNAFSGAGLDGIELIFLVAFTTFMAIFIAIFMGMTSLKHVAGAVIMTAFAPFFALVGILPTRGKRIFLGYLGKIFSAIAKAVLAATLTLIYITILGSVIGATKELITGIILVMIFSWATWAYKDAFFNLLGNIDLGGESLSRSKFRDTFLGKKATQVGKAGVRVAGAAGMGAVMGEGAKKSALEAAGRELSRSRGLVGGAFQQRNRIKAGRNGNINEIRSGLQKRLHDAETERNKNNVAVEANKERVQGIKVEVARKEKALDSERKKNFDVNVKAQLKDTTDKISAMERAREITSREAAFMRLNAEGTLKKQVATINLETATSPRAKAAATADLRNANLMLRMSENEMTKNGYVDKMNDIKTSTDYVLKDSQINGDIGRVKSMFSDIVKDTRNIEDLTRKIDLGTKEVAKRDEEIRNMRNEEKALNEAETNVGNKGYNRAQKDRVNAESHTISDVTTRDNDIARTASSPIARSNVDKDADTNFERKKLESGRDLETERDLQDYMEEMDRKHKNAKKHGDTNAAKRFEDQFDEASRRLENLETANTSKPFTEQTEETSARSSETPIEILNKFIDKKKS